MSTSDPPPLPVAARVWLRIGLLSFGGPAAQIALMHKEIVDERRWLTEQQFLNALNFCMLLPGPEAMQLATYAGWRLHGVVGGLIAGLLFVTPGAALILALALLYGTYGDLPVVAAVFFGIKAAVLVIVVEALARVATKALIQPLHWGIAGGAFVALFFFAVPYPLIILVAGTLGSLLTAQHGQDTGHTRHHVAFGDTARTIALWLAIWVLPLLILAAFGPDLLTQIGIFFSKLAVVTFGGAYAVLAYMTQAVVLDFNWLTAGEMVDALGLAETTPGPLILVTQFVGVLAGIKDGGPWLGVAAAFVVLWVTFTPCFLWIFAGAPYIDWISGQPRLQGALTGITAAVVGVILNLSLWFALHVFFAQVVAQRFGPVTLWRPELASLDWLAFALFLFSCVLAFGLRWGVIRILLVASVVGAVLKLVM